MWMLDVDGSFQAQGQAQAQICAGLGRTAKLVAVAGANEGPRPCRELVERCQRATRRCRWVAAGVQRVLSRCCQSTPPECSCKHVGV